MSFSSCIALTTLPLCAIQVLKTTDTGVSAWRRLIKFLSGQIGACQE